jgi:hypothetical protein
MTEGDMTAEMVERDIENFRLADLMQYARDALTAEYDTLSRGEVRRRYRNAFLEGEYPSSRQYKVYRPKAAEESPTVYIGDDARGGFVALSPDTFRENIKIVFETMEEGGFTYTRKPPTFDELEFIGVLYKDRFEEVK